jgi:hypothetical protein
MHLSTEFRSAGQTMITDIAFSRLIREHRELLAERERLRLLAADALKE